MITLYGIPNCDSVKKAKNWLDSQQIGYTFHNFKKQGVPKAEAERWLREAGTEAVINKRGTTWRKLPATKQADANQLDQALLLISENSSLIKRPVITAGKTLLIGFDEELMEEAKSTLKTL
jgi:Spx/MgsR family transcriptional regulator